MFNKKCVYRDSKTNDCSHEMETVKNTNAVCSNHIGLAVQDSLRGVPCEMRNAQVTYGACAGNSYPDGDAKYCRRHYEDVMARRVTNMHYVAEPTWRRCADGNPGLCSGQLVTQRKYVDLQLKDVLVCQYHSSPKTATQASIMNDAEKYLSNQAADSLQKKVDAVNGILRGNYQEPQIKSHKAKAKSQEEREAKEETLPIVVESNDNCCVCNQKPEYTRESSDYSNNVSRKVLRANHVGWLFMDFPHDPQKMMKSTWNKNETRWACKKCANSIAMHIRYIEKHGVK